MLGFVGTEPGQFDVLHVTDKATLSGRLEVHFLNGFLPADPEAFLQSRVFVEAEQGIVGDFDERGIGVPTAVKSMGGLKSLFGGSGGQKPK